MTRTFAALLVTAPLLTASSSWLPSMAAESAPAATAGKPRVAPASPRPKPAASTRTSSSGKIEWLEWGSDAFRRAAVRERPILLNIVVSWSRQCRDMEAVWADPRVAAAVNSGWVAVRVDAEKRPDIRERYPSTTWPAVTLLLPNGVPFYAGREDEKIPSRVTIGALPAERIVKILGEARDWLRTPAKVPLLRKTVEEGQKAEVEAPLDPGQLDPATAGKILDTLRVNFDALHGGWTKAPKFPLTAPIEACLFAYSHDKDARALEVAERALRAIVDGPLFDRVGGGVHRIAASEDWSRPEYEKLLDRNVALLEQLLAARVVTSKPEYSDRAGDIVRWLESSMARPGGGFHASQSFDPATADGGGYYRLAAADRARKTAPSVDTLVPVGWSAKAAAAEMRAAYIIGRPELMGRGRQTLDWLLAQGYQRGRGVVHAIDGEKKVLPLYLEDQVLFAEGALDAYQLTGDKRYLAASKDVAEVAIVNLRDPQTQLFGDIAPNPMDPAVPMRKALHPFEWNCRMARLLSRLYYLNRQEKPLRDGALGVLEAYASGYARGPIAAQYAMALSEYHEGPMWVWIIGSPNIPGTPSMFAAVSLVPTLWKLVVQLDPGNTTDARSITQMGFVYRRPPAAYFTSGTHTSRPAQFPSEIPQCHKALMDVLALDKVRAAEAAKGSAAEGGESDESSGAATEKEPPAAPPGGGPGGGMR